MPASRPPSSGQPCRLCGSRRLASSRSFRSFQTGECYALLQCRSCASEFFDPAESLDLARLYDQEYEARTLPPFRRQQYWSDEVSRLCKIRGGRVESVLDIGCGDGDFLRHWPRDVKRVGVELSGHRARSSPPDIAIVRERIEHHRASHPYDIVTLYAILEHLEQPLSLLSRLPDLVTTQGVVAIMVPTHQSLKAKLIAAAGRRWHMYNPPLHLSFLSRRVLDNSMTSHGFKLVERRWTSGGMINPFAANRLLRGIWWRAMYWSETRTPLQRVPLFDHMYSYYVRDR